MAMLTVKVDNPGSYNVVMGQIPLVSTMSDICEALSRAVPQVSFGLAFIGKEMPEPVTHAGTDDMLIELARQNAGKIAANQTFILFTDNSSPQIVMKALKDVSDIEEIYCATTRPVEILMIEKAQRRDVMGLVGAYS